MKKEILDAYTKFLNAYEIETEIDTSHYSSKTIHGKIEEPQKCRFCEMEIPQTTFKTDSHLIPAFLGSRFLLSAYECDNCNSTFKAYENDLANFIGPIRSITKITGKSKSPKHKQKDLTIFQDADDKVMFVSKDFVDKIEKGERIVQIDVTKSRFTPINVYKAFLKIGLSLIAESDVGNFPMAYEFLQKDNESFRNLKDSMNIIRIFVPGPALPEFPIVHLWKRKDKSFDVPEKILVIHIKNLKFQIMLPFNLLDTHLEGKKLDVPICPVVLTDEYINQYGDLQFEVIDLSSNNIVIDKTEGIGVRISNLEKYNS